MRAHELAKSVSEDDAAVTGVARQRLGKPELVALATLVQDSILAALVASASSDALDWFPRLLQFLELYEEITPSFKQRSMALPSLVFLKWLPQVRRHTGRSVRTSARRSHTVRRVGAGAGAAGRSSTVRAR